MKGKTIQLLEDRKEDLPNAGGRDFNTGVLNGKRWTNWTICFCDPNDSTGAGGKERQRE